MITKIKGLKISIEVEEFQFNDNPQATNDPDLALIPETNMGTVEPISNVKDKDKEEFKGETIAFVRGFIRKYKSSNLKKTEMFDYLEKLIGGL